MELKYFRKCVIITKVLLKMKRKKEVEYGRE